MKLKTRDPFPRILACLLGTVLVVAGCSTAKQDAGTTDQRSLQAHERASKAQNGVQLWAQNCGHCHNVRSPDAYSAAQWDVAMLHMRIRANLTTQEHKAILEFLRSATPSPSSSQAGASSTKK